MIYKNIADLLRNEINSHKFAIGDAIPSEKKLAESFSVSRMTIRRAIDELIHLRLVSREQGRGTFIIAKDFHFGVTKLTSFKEIVSDANIEGRTVVIDFKIINAPLSISSKLELNNDEKVFYSRRIRYINNKAVMVEDSYMPFKLFKNLSVEHLEESKFHYIENICNISIEGSYEACYAIMPDQGISKLLSIEPNQPILLLTTLSYSSNNQFINYAIIYRNTNEYNFEYHLKRHENTLISKKIQENEV
ncbi:hypothetical protein A9G11_12335 [Gilliamella sp. wkB108]|uniref:GntR family transcriptional regulator n=1 Tax=Gilliamella sp. wkB108 TaxID=3120256 RepID=UPI00080ED3EF|nr:GntR family transcriptional regulator [Gilliamella apicola]OCG27877.1 hypothetical protein A9G11_12335 [Gilliamella apicola]